MRKNVRKNSSLRRLLTNIFGYSFFNSLLLLAPVYAIFMQDHGMSDIQLSSLFIIWSAAIFVMQIPVTWIQKKIGVKNIIVLGQVCKAAAFIIWLVWPTYIGFALGQFLWGIQGAIYNVSFEGMMYDELHARKHHGIYARVLGIRSNISTIGSMLSASGSLLLFFGYDLITWLSVLAMVISMIFVMRIRPMAKTVVVKKSKKNTGFMKFFMTGVRIIHKTPCMFYMLLLVVMVSNFSYLNDYLSLIGVQIGLRKEFVGIVPFFIMCCQMIGRGFAHRLTGVRDSLLFGSVAVAGALFVSFSIFYSGWGLLLLGGAYVMFSGINILLYSRFQDFVPTIHRPVALSLYSIADNGLYMAVLFVIGLCGDAGSYRYAVLFMGMMCILVGLWAILFVRDRCAINQNPNLKVIKTTDSTSSNSASKF